MIVYQSIFVGQNPVEILKTVYQRESLTNVRNFCLEKICETYQLKGTIVEIALKT